MDLCLKVTHVFILHENETFNARSPPKSSVCGRRMFPFLRTHASLKIGTKAHFKRRRAHNSVISLPSESVGEAAAGAASRAGEAGGRSLNNNPRGKG